MPYSFTSESVSEGHRDKIADQISDSILDNFLAFDPTSKVACETLVTTVVVIAGGTIRDLPEHSEHRKRCYYSSGYTKSEYIDSRPTAAVY